MENNKVKNQEKQPLKGTLIVEGVCLDLTAVGFDHVPVTGLPETDKLLNVCASGSVRKDRYPSLNPVEFYENLKRKAVAVLSFTWDTNGQPVNAIQRVSFAELIGWFEEKSMGDEPDRIGFNVRFNLMHDPSLEFGLLKLKGLGE
jgi:hypothetical protein